MARITYLLGAGASIGSLPVVDNFENEIREILNRLRVFLGNVPDDMASTYVGDRGLIFMAIKDLQMLLEGCNKHRSVDTFAKMLFLTSHDKERERTYRRVKCSIILFFELYRFFTNKTDKRYDAFLATIINNANPKFPSEINIISWNYDYEFERAYMNYSPEKKNIHEVYNDLNIIHKNSNAAKSIGNNFGIIKINGTAGFYTANKELILGLDNHFSIASGVNDKDSISVIPFLKNYKKYADDTAVEPAISFSWEEDKGAIKVIDEISKAVANTQVFIIIGYSFPYFNRAIDKKIASSISYGGTTIYLQDPIADDLVDTVLELKQWIFGSIGKIKPIKNCNQFYLNI